jgi:radical SAM-linked protein
MPTATTDPLAQKVCLTFAKSGAAIYLSHLDLARHWARTLRRADLQVRLTAGFNPRPRVVFPHPLPLGVASACEQVEIEFGIRYPLPQLFTALKTGDGGVLELLRLEEMRTVKSGRVVVSCDYEIRGWTTNLAPQLARASAEIIAAPTLPVWHGHGEKRRQLDLRPFLAALVLAADGASVTAKLLHTATGAGRIDELALLLAEKCGGAVSATALTLQKIAMHFRAD